MNRLTIKPWFNWPNFWYLVQILLICGVFVGYLVGSWMVMGIFTLLILLLVLLKGDF